MALLIDMPRIAGQKVSSEVIIDPFVSQRHLVNVSGEMAGNFVVHHPSAVRELNLAILQELCPLRPLLICQEKVKLTM